MAFLTSQAIVSLFVMLAAAAVCAALRRSPAAQRHFVWTVAFSSLLVIPLLATLVPRPPRKALVESVVVTTASVQAMPVATAISEPIPWGTVAGGLWGAGTVLLLLRIAGGLAICAYRRRRAAPFPASASISADVRITSAVSVAETFGLWRPVVLLPEEARNWTEDRHHIVLLHELIHIQRRDWAIHMIARVAASLFWFNPLCWYALTRLRDEQELACDDGVLRAGVAQSDYAYQLIEIAKDLHMRPNAFVVAMARTPHIEARIRAILNPQRNRRRLTLKDKYFTLIPAVLIVAAASLVTAPAQTGHASLSGTVRDPSGAVIPEASVVIADGKGQETVRTNEVGKFEFSGIPDGRYSLQIMKPGFKVFEKRDVETGAASPVQLDATLEIGRISESIQVVAQGQTRRYPPRPATSEPNRTRVGGNIQPAKVVNHVRPQYPQHLAAQGVEGTVLLIAVIGKNGQVLNAEAKNLQVDPELIKAALEAVKQWRYEPTLLNGEPVEVITTITVDFRLKP